VPIPSKTQIDKLGERLRAGSIDEPDLRELDNYRRSFGTAYEHVLESWSGRTEDFKGVEEHLLRLVEA